jgi:Topoisomerase DNA binding C4 zinc finger.
VSRKETKMASCVFCGESATKQNQEGQPVCREHADQSPKNVECPDCGLPMKLKEGRYGFFWGCEGYPQCQKTFQVQELAGAKDE